MIKNKNFATLLSSIAILVLFAFSLNSVVAWVEPSVAPTGGNVAAPLRFETDGNFKMPTKWTIAGSANGNWGANFLEVRTAGWTSGSGSYAGIAGNKIYAYGGLQSGGVVGNEAAAGQLYVSGNSMLVGNVGIGTLAPAANLHVVGSIRLDTTPVTPPTPVLQTYLPVSINGQSYFIPLYTATTIPTPPSGMSAFQPGPAGSGIDMTWVDNSNNETEFRVERSIDSFGFLNIANLGANTITHFDNDVNSATQHRYRVRACNAAGCSGYSNISTVILK